MKKLFSVLMSAVVLVCSVCGFNMVALAAKQTQDIEETPLAGSDTYYSFDADSKTLIIGGTGNTPDFRNDSVSQPWYLWRSDGSIEHIVVLDGVTGIGDYFFYSVKTQDITLASTVKSIGNYAMSNMKTISEIDLPDGVSSIGDYAFYFSTTLKSVNIPSSVKSIGASAFENCISLENVVFEDMYSDVSIGRKAFLNCTALNNVSVPKRAQLMSYSLGFYDDQRGCVYDDFVMAVYRDSAAYTYAVNNIVDYTIINEMTITEGQTVLCSYYRDSYEDDMVFIFTPLKSDLYSFYSSGAIDVDCEFDSKLYDDNSLDDLNFTVTEYLEQGSTYYFTVKCVSGMSVGDFSVTMDIIHNYNAQVTLPTLTEGGYTQYTCSYCGESYRADFTDRLGVLVTGRVTLLCSPNGQSPDDPPVKNAVFSVGGSNVAVTDSNGEFEFYILPSDEKLCLGTEFSVDRTFDIVKNDDMSMDLGDVSLLNFDFFPDGYINVKDFAVLRKAYGEYDMSDPAQSVIYSAFDCDCNGVINYNDFLPAKNFITYGGLDESIYE